MTTTVSFLSLFSLISLTQDNAAKTIGPSPENSSFQILVEIVGDPVENAVALAEAAHADLLKLGKQQVPATYALALIYAHENFYDRAVRALDALPNAAKYFGPILRLRLFLALERGEKGLPDKLLVLLREQVAKPSGSDPEHLDTARFLGGLAGATPPGASLLFDQSTFDEMVRALESSPETKISNEFRVARSAASKRREALALLAAGAGDKASAEANAKAAETEVAGAAASLQAAKEELTVTIRNNSAAHAETVAQIRKLSAVIRELEREWRLETPGRPRQPMRPTEPDEPSRNGKKDDVSQSDRIKYQRDMDRYRSGLRDYEREVLEYPRKVAQWQEKDRIRRAELLSKRQMTDAEVAAARKVDKERADAADTLRDDIKKQQFALKDLNLKHQLLKTIAAGAGEEGNSMLLSRPSNYGLISFSSERQRLLKVGR